MKKNLRRTLLGLFIFVIGIVVSSSANAFELHNMWTGDCLGVKAGNPNPGTAMITWQCDGSANQQFSTSIASYTTVPNSTTLWTTFYLYDQVARNRVLGVANNSLQWDAPVIIWAPDGSANQLWTMIDLYTYDKYPSLLPYRCYAIINNSGTTILSVKSNPNDVWSLDRPDYWYVEDNQGNVYTGQPVGIEPLHLGARALPLNETAHFIDTTVSSYNQPWFDPYDYPWQYWCVY